MYLEISVEREKNTLIVEPFFHFVWFFFSKYEMIFLGPSLTDENTRVMYYILYIYIYVYMHYTLYNIYIHDRFS